MIHITKVVAIQPWQSIKYIANLIYQMSESFLVSSCIEPFGELVVGDLFPGYVFIEMKIEERLNFKIDVFERRLNEHGIYFVKDFHF
jgi:transcription antitermination factor NusG